MTIRFERQLREIRQFDDGKVLYVSLMQDLTSAVKKCRECRSQVLPDSSIERNCVRQTSLHVPSSEEAFLMFCRYDITDVLLEAGISSEDVFNAHAPFTIKVEIHAVNGSALPPASLPAPTISFQPAHGALAV